MGAQNLGSILAAAEGVAAHVWSALEAALRDTSVTGIELYQPGTATSYKDRLVLVRRAHSRATRTCGRSRPSVPALRR